jgi:hypothetical protein
MKPIASLLIVTFVAGCARDVHVTHPYATPTSGTVEVVLNRPTRSLTVAVDGALVVDRERSRRARIDGVPAGLARISIATGGGCEAGRTVDRDVEVFPGRTTTITVPGPEPNAGCMIYSGLYYVGLNIGILAIVIAAGASSPRPAK